MAMRSLSELGSFVRQAARLVAQEKDFTASEIYCSSTEHIVARLNYTSDIPCSGVEEVKSLAADGFTIRVVSARNPHQIGTASEAGDLSLDSVRAAMAKARRAMVVDPDFPGLPEQPRRLATGRDGVSDLMRAGDAPLVAAAWQIVRSAVETFDKCAPSGLESPGLVVGGDVSLVRDRIAIANSHFGDLRAGESAHFTSSVTALVEALDAKGTASAIGSSTTEMRRIAPAMGRDAILRALQLGRGERPASGVYRVLLGPQPVAEILNYMVIGSLTTGAFYSATSAYHGRFGEQVMDPRLSIVDDPALKRGAIRRKVTCEGLPARRTELIRAGRLVGLLSNFYDAHRLATDDDRAEKLGPNAGNAAAGVVKFPAQNGYRLAEGGGRRFDANPGAAGTNVVMRAREGSDERALLRALGDGIYVGRVWYTYPINGQRAGQFTCTVSGDSYLVRNGEIAAPLAPNSVRINAHIDQVFKGVVAAGKRSYPALIWGTSEAYYVPAIVADAIALAPVGATE